MTVQISPQTEAKLREKATLEGRNIDETAETLLDFALEWEAQERTETIAGIRVDWKPLLRENHAPFASSMWRCVIVITSLLQKKTYEALHRSSFQNHFSPIKEN